MCNKVGMKTEKSVSLWFRKCQHWACLYNFYSTLCSMHSFTASNYQLRTVFSTISHLSCKNMESQWSHRKLLTAVVETPMWKVLLSFTEQDWAYSKQPRTSCWAENNIHRFALKWLPCSLDLKAAVASALSTWSTGKTSVRIFLWFLKIPFGEISPTSCHRLIQDYCSYSLDIWASFWKMAYFWYGLQLEEACWMENIGRPLEHFLERSSVAPSITNLGDQ